MNIGIIGSGNIGSVLSIKLIKLGHQVYLANSRGPASLKEFSEQTGVILVTVHEAVKNADLVIITIPEQNVADLPKELFKGVPENVVIIDTCNYYPTRDGVISVIEEGLTESEWVQQQLNRKVVKAFNNIIFTSLRDLGMPKGQDNRIALPISGDDAAAKEIVMKLVDDLGLDPVDLGKLNESWKQQPGTSLYCTDLNSKELVSSIREMGLHSTSAFKKQAEATRHAQRAAYLKSMEKAG